MNTKNLVLMSLLVGVGAVLYIIIPGFNGGMKPDFMLTMMFIGILLFPDVKSVFLTWNFNRSYFWIVFYISRRICSKYH